MVGGSSALFGTATNDQVYLYDAQAGTVALLSTKADYSKSGTGPSDNPIISSDGRYVVYRSSAADIAPGTDFFDLGGDSLAAARIFTAVRKQFGVGITLDQLYQVHTIKGMSAFIAAAGAA